MKNRLTRSNRWLTTSLLVLTLGVMAFADAPADAGNKKKKKKKKQATTTESSQPAQAPSAAVNKANGYLLEFSTAKARTALQPEMEDPTAFAVTSMGRVLIQEGRYDEAIAELESAAAMAKSDPDPQIFLGEALLLADRSTDARSAFRKAGDRAEQLIAGDPENGWAHFQLGVARQRLQKFDDALASLEEARRLMPNEALVVFQLGVTQAFRQDWRPAFDLLSEAIDKNSKIAYAYYYRGLSADKVGRGDLLVNDLHRFLELAPDAPEADRVRRILSAATG